MWTGYLLSPVFSKLMVQLSVLQKKTNTNLIFISKDNLTCPHTTHYFYVINLDYEAGYRDYC